MIDKEIIEKEGCVEGHLLLINDTATAA